MRKKMFVRLLIEYVIFGITSFLTISLLIPQMVHVNTIKSESAAMYRQANYISSAYGPAVMAGTDSYIQSATAQLKAVDRYLQCDVMLVDTNGNIAIDTYGHYGCIENFDPSVSGNKYYFEGNFFGTFDHDTLSVIAPINVNYTLKGYVLIHKDIDVIFDKSNTVFNYNYITMLLSLIHI